MTISPLSIKDGQADKETCPYENQINDLNLVPNSKGYIHIRLNNILS